MVTFWLIIKYRAFYLKVQRIHRIYFVYADTDTTLIQKYLYQRFYEALFKVNSILLKESKKELGRACIIFSQAN